MCLCLSVKGQRTRIDSLVGVYTNRGAAHCLDEELLLPSYNASQAFIFDTLLPAVAAAYGKRPDPWLRVHLLRLQANEASVYKNFDNSKGIRPLSLKLAEEAIRLCLSEKNDLLLAETYFDIAELYNFYQRHEEYLTMLTRAFEIADRLGEELFPESLLFFKLGGMCKAAYHVFDYRESLAYGYRALAVRKRFRTLPDMVPDVFLLDLMGACYKKLGQPDSSTRFYNRVLQTLEDDRLRPDFRRLWTGIALGNIGENLTTTGQLSKGMPLLLQWEKVAEAFADTLNLCLSKNALALNCLARKDYNRALAYWKDVYSWSVTQGNFEYARKAAEGMALVFRKQGNPDKAFGYYEATHRYGDSLTARINRSGLKAVKARVALDNLQHSLENANRLLEKEKQHKQLVVVGIALLAAIAILLYSRQQLKISNKLERTERLRREAENEIGNARLQIEGFVNNLRDKNELIESLRQKIAAEEALQEIYASLDSYTLVTDEQWDRFRKDFIQAYPFFLTELAGHLPQMTPAEERLSVLIFLGLTGPQTAATLGIGRQSVTRARHRLARRLGIAGAGELEIFMRKLLHGKV